MNDVLVLAREWLAVGWVQAILVVVGAIIAGKVLDAVVCRTLSRLAKKSNTEIDDKLIENLHRPIFITVVFLGLNIALQLLALPTRFTWIVGGILKTLLVFIWLGASLRISSLLLEGLGKIADRVRWLEARTIPLFDNVAKIGIFAGGLYAMLLIWQMDITAFLASAGILGLAVGFAAKDTIANLFGGIFLILDSPYQIGDYINLDSGERGVVTKIGLRSTRVLTRNDVEITIPIALIANSTIINESGGPSVRFRTSISVGVAYGSDIDKVREVLMAAAVSVAEVVDDPEPRIRFIEMGDSALIYKIQCWIAEPSDRGRAVDGLNTAVYKALGTAGISIPFPQRDVHLFQAGS